MAAASLRMVGDRPLFVSVRFNGLRDLPAALFRDQSFPLRSSRLRGIVSWHLVKDLFRNRLRRHSLGKPNFSFQKRQKELARKKKNEEKRQRKLEKNSVTFVEDQQGPADVGVSNKDRQF